jgi:hypothetical protein
LAVVRVLVRFAGLVGVSLFLLAGCASSNPTGAPPEVRTEVLSPTEVMLRWQPDKDVAAYRVERRDGLEAPFAEVGITGTSAASHLNTGLTPGATYVWRLRACTRDHCSPYSSEVSAKLPL